MGFAKAREVDGFLTDAARELTTNCLRHSNCKSIVVSVCRGAEGISMEVIDDGRGADSLRFGHGLTEVAARAERYGGHLSVSSHPGRFKAALYLPFVLNTPKS
jgi:signal transduction histidine kinase